MIKRRDKSAPLPRDSAPAERWGHGTDVEVTAIGREQIARPVAALLRSGKIGQAEATAAERYYADFALGVCGARDTARVGRGGGSDGITGAQIAAMESYRRAAAAIGRRADALLRELVIEETSLRAMAKARGHASTHFVCGMVVFALSILADHYSGGAPTPAPASAIRAADVA
jgi:hypothetical protein